MDKAVWDSKYSVNVKEIDEQHKNLIRLINEIYENIEKQADVRAYDSFFDDLLKHTITHFATEEKYFGEFDYVDSVAHVGEHNKIKSIVVELQKKYLDDPNINIIFETSSFLDSWLTGHIMNYDKKYTKCFNDHGLF